MSQPPQVLSSFSSLHSPFSPILHLPRSSCPIRVFLKSFKHQLLSYPEPLAFSWEIQRGQTTSFSILDKGCISQFTPFPVYLPHLFAPPSCGKLPSGLVGAVRLPLRGRFSSVAMATTPLHSSPHPVFGDCDTSSPHLVSTTIF